MCAAEGLLVKDITVLIVATDVDYDIIVCVEDVIKRQAVQYETLVAESSQSDFQPEVEITPLVAWNVLCVHSLVHAVV